MKTRSFPMLSRREALVCAAVAVVLPARAQSLRPARPDDGSPSSLHLLDGGLRAGIAGQHRAGIRMMLKSGFKTYWRSPGDTGVPPQFDFSASDNLARAEVHFPRPVRFADGAGGHSIGYDSPEVVFPVSIIASDATRPVILRLKADYAICKDICVPATAELEMRLGAGGSAGDASARSAIEAAEHMVPRSMPFGDKAALSIVALEKGQTAEAVLVTVKAGTQADLFVEAPSPWFFETRDAPPKSGLKRFEIVAIERDRTPECRGVDLTMTLVSGDQAIEVKTWLDAGLLGP